MAGCGMSFARWMTGLLAAWAWAVSGGRTSCDLTSVKKSEDHTLSPDQGWACTEFVGGRNKLHGNKRGTRSWAMYYCCLCPGGVHKGAPANLALDEHGNPVGPLNFPTYCPLNCLAIKKSLSAGALHVFSKWASAQLRFGKKNHGDVTGLANEWFRAQNALEENRPYDSNSGRRALAGWLQETHTPYHEGFEVHADLYSARSLTRDFSTLYK